MYKIIVQMKKQPAGHILSAFLVFFILVGAVEAREIPLPDEESATSLFDAQLDDAEVDFFIEGNWTANLSGGFGVTWGDTVQGVQPAVLPDFTDGFSFQQIPELTLSLWYKGRYFFETSITRDQTLETFLFGYYGEEGSFLQEARVGNTDIGYGEAGTFSIPAASRESLGGYTLMESESTTHQAAFRYDPAQSEEIHYRGSSLIEEERIGVKEYIRGRFFILPDEDVDSLEVYLQDDEGGFSDGDGRRYRRLDDSEMVRSSADGLVFLNEPAAGDLAVHYSKDGLFVGDPLRGLGALCGVSGSSLDPGASAEDFNFGAGPYLGLDLGSLERTIGGKTVLVLFQPGQWSPFELQGAYASGLAGSVSTDRLNLLLADRNGSDGPELPAARLHDPDILRISPDGTGIRDHAARYPLLGYLSVFPDPDEIYGPGAAGGTAAISKELLFEKLTPVSSYNIGTNALEGSVEVLRNGIPTGNYSFNPETGEINFFIPPAAGERIDIIYRSQTSKAVGGDIFAVTSNTLQFGDRWSADLNVGLRWNADPSAYITEDGEAEGSILTSGRISYSTEELSFSIEGGVNVSNPNTTGRLRLFGMDDSAFPLTPDVENLYPGAPVTTTQYTAAGGLDLSHSDRGALYYRDYFDYSFAEGYSLQHYSWDPPGDQVYTYDQSGGDNRVGPYLAATGDETAGNAMVLEYELSADQWVAGIIPVASGNGAVDLSHARALTFLIKSLGRAGSSPAGDIDIHILLGRLSEDLDDDEELDEESSPYDQGFTFNIPGGETAQVSPALTWSPQDSSINSEDLDGNGVLDGSSAVTTALDEPFIAVSKETAGVTSPSISPGTWYRITIPLDSAARKKLQAVTALEFVLEESAIVPAAASGRILVADIDLQGTPFTGSALDDTTLDIYTRALDPGGIEYDALYSFGDAELLNGGSIFNTKVLNLSWGTPNPGPNATLTAAGFLTPVDIGDYKSLSFFMKTDSNPPVDLTLSIQNPEGEGMAVQFSPPADTGWSQYTWHLDASADADRITRNGSAIAGGGADVSGGAGLDRKRNTAGINTITLTANVTSNGSMEIDEIFLHDPILGVGAGGLTDIEYNRPGPLLTIKNIPVIQDIDFQQRIYGRQDGYGGGLTPAPVGNLSFSNSLGFSVTDARLSFDYNGRWDGNEYFPAGGYQAAVPLFGNHFIIKDRYHEEGTHDDIEMTKESSLRVQNTDFLSYTFTSLLDYDGREMYRTWDSRAEFLHDQDISASIGSEFTSSTDQLSVDEGDFWRRYGRASLLIYPDYTEGQISRTTAHSIHIKRPGEDITWDFSPSLSSMTHPDELPFSLTSGNGIDLSLSIQLPGRGETRGSISYTYTRSGSLRQDHPADTGFCMDMAEVLERLPDFPMVWTSPPVIELWSSDLRDTFSNLSEGKTAAEYSTQNAFTYARQPGSLWTDLFLPKSFSAVMRRDLQRQLDSVTDSLSFEGEYLTTALNVFGALGRYPFFEWYRTEEISHSLSCSGTVPLAAGTDETYKITAGQFLQLKLNEKSTLGASSEWNGSFFPYKSEELYEYSGHVFWERKKQVQWKLPLQEQLKTEDQFLIHREEMEIGLQDKNENIFTYTITGGHTSELRLPETGYARAFGRFGFEQNIVTAAGEQLLQYILAIEIGIELELRF